MEKINTNNIIIRFSITGFLIGIAFVTILLSLDFYVFKSSFFASSPEQYILLHKTTHVLYFFDTLPFILALSGFLIGNKFASNTQELLHNVTSDDDKSKVVFKFVEQLREGNIEAVYETSDDDALGKSLISLRDRLQSNKIGEASRRKEDEERHWVTEGDRKSVV